VLKDNTYAINFIFKQLILICVKRISHKAQNKYKSPETLGKKKKKKSHKAYQKELRLVFFFYGSLTIIHFATESFFHSILSFLITSTKF